MLSDPWRLQPAVPDLIGDGGSTDDEDDYDDTGFADPYEVARKVREANARLRADSTPLESSRERRVRFRDPIRAVLCFTPEGEDEESSKDEEPPAEDDEDDQEGDASVADDAASRYSTVRRLVTAAAVERRGSLTSEELPLTSPATAGGLGSKNSSEKLLGLGADSDEDIDSFESDNTSVSEAISDLTDDRDDNQDVSVQEVSDVSEDESGHGDRPQSPETDSHVGVEPSPSPEDRRETKPSLSRDSSVEEAAFSSMQEEVPSGATGESVQSRNEEEAFTVGGSPDRGPQGKKDSVPAPSADSSHSQDGRTRGGALQKATAAPQSRATGIRPSASQAKLVSIYGGAPRPTSTGAGARVGLTTQRAATAGRGRSGFVASEATQRSHRPWSGPTQAAAAPSASRLSSARSAARTSEEEQRVHAKQPQQKRQQASPRQARTADESKTATTVPCAVAVGSVATSTYALPRELKEELVRKKRRERELREQREAREERERRQRAQEAELAFKAWLAKKRRQGSLPRSDRSEESSSRSESSRTTDEGGRPRASSSAAFEAWLRRKQRQQREEELRRKLRQLELEATERPRRSRHEAQQVYLAWLERKCEEERQRHLAAWAERRGGREATLSARSLRILERYLRSDEFARYPELVV